VVAGACKAGLGVEVMHGRSSEACLSAGGVCQGRSWSLMQRVPAVVLATTRSTRTGGEQRQAALPPPHMQQHLDCNRGGSQPFLCCTPQVAQAKAAAAEARSQVAALEEVGDCTLHAWAPTATSLFAHLWALVRTPMGSLANADLTQCILF